MTAHILLSKLFLILALIQCIAGDFSDGHYHWLVGSPSDFVVPNPASLLGGVVMSGGGGDVDSAMQWFLRRAAGGDVIVMRNADNGTTDLDDPEADKYNLYFYSQLGVRVNSVETILFNGRWVAENPVVIEKIRRAEAVFFSGGDQAVSNNFSAFEKLDEFFILNFFLNKLKRRITSFWKALHY